MILETVFYTIWKWISVSFHHKLIENYYYYLKYKKFNHNLKRNANKFF